MDLITSRHHPAVKAFREADRRPDLALLDGWHLLEEAVAARLAIETIALAGRVPAKMDDLFDRACAGGAAVLSVSDPVMDALSPVRSPSGVAAIVQRPRVDPQQLLAPAPALVVVAVGVQDPGNLGAIIRAADAGGATGVLVDHGCADPWGWKALRAAMGSTFRFPVYRVPDVRDTLEEWQHHGIAIVATAPTGAPTMYERAFTGPTALVLGTEGAGLDQALLEMADVRVSIPMRATTESLNVAVAAALLVYEARRQRQP